MRASAGCVAAAGMLRLRGHADRQANAHRYRKNPPHAHESTPLTGIDAETPPFVAGKSLQSHPQWLRSPFTFARQIPAMPRPSWPAWLLPSRVTATNTPPADLLTRCLMSRPSTTACGKCAFLSLWLEKELSAPSAAMRM